MALFLSTIVLGITSGALDALLALGIVLIYRTTGVLNFAQAGIGAVSAYVMLSVSSGRPLIVGVFAGLLAGAGLGILTNVLVSGIRARHYALVSAVATLAVAILLQQVIQIGWGTTAGQFPSPFGLGGLTFGEVTITDFEGWAVAVAAALALGTGTFLRFSRTGTMIRALADNAEAARLSGGSVPLLVGGVWAAAGVLAAVAGFFAAQIIFDPVFLDPFFVAALIASVLGGLRSLTGAFAGAIALEVARDLFNSYAPSTYTPYAQTFLLILLIAVLVLAPRRWLAATPERSV